MVEVESGKKLSLSKLILLKDSLSTKIQNIDSIIKKSNITFDVLGELLTIKKNTQEFAPQFDDKGFIENLVKGVVNNQSQIDELITKLNEMK